MIWSLTGSISIAATIQQPATGLSCLILIVGFKVSGKVRNAKIPFRLLDGTAVHRGTDRLVHHHSGRLRVLQNLARPHSASGCRSVWRRAWGLPDWMLVKLWMGAFNVRLGGRIDFPAHGPPVRTAVMMLLPCCCRILHGSGWVTTSFH